MSNFTSNFSSTAVAAVVTSGISNGFDNLSHGDIAVLVVASGVMILLISYYIRIGQRMISLDRDSASKKPYVKGSIIYTDTEDDDIEAAHLATTISQYSSETAPAMHSLASLTGMVSMMLAFLSIPGLDSNNDHLFIISAFNITGYLGLSLVGMFPTAPIDDPKHGTRRTYNRVLCFNIPIGISMLIHSFAASLFLWMPAISTLIYCTVYDQSLLVFAYLQGSTIITTTLFLITQLLQIYGHVS